VVVDVVSAVTEVVVAVVEDVALAVVTVAEVVVEEDAVAVVATQLLAPTEALLLSKSTIPLHHTELDF